MAAITLQRIRRNFFKNKIDDLGSQKIIYGLLRKEIKKIIDQSETFRIATAAIVLINKDVYALETLSES